MSEYLDKLWADLERTWELAEKVNDKTPEERRDAQTLWDSIFKVDALVDVEATEKQGAMPPKAVYCKNIYGIRLDEKTSNWIPFRHGPVDFSNEKF
jgi:hypothetical protein